MQRFIWELENCEISASGHLFFQISKVNLSQVTAAWRRPHTQDFTVNANEKRFHEEGKRKSLN